MLLQSSAAAARLRRGANRPGAPEQPGADGRRTTPTSRSSCSGSDRAPPAGSRDTARPRSCRSSRTCRATPSRPSGSASCYGFCSGTGEEPDLLRASVASSGYADVAAYPDTWRGFNLALLHLRDGTRRTCKLAFHVSNWATGRDIGSDTDPTLDAAAQGTIAGSVRRSERRQPPPRPGHRPTTSCSTTSSDRDAGYYKYVVGRPNAFWDRLNVTLPNFARWEELPRRGDRGDRPAGRWSGRSPSATSRSTRRTTRAGHYQDNRAEYFFGHIAELPQHRDHRRAVRPRQRRAARRTPTTRATASRTRHRSARRTG